MLTDPTISDFKARFARDFPYGTDDTKVQNADIQSALEETTDTINQDLFGEQSDYSRAFLFLAAHFLTTNLQNSAQGVDGAYNWLTVSKAAGSVNQGFTIPESILKNPALAQIAQTTYGARYIGMILPRISGNMAVVAGGTTP